LYGGEISHRLQAYVNARGDATLSFLTSVLLDDISWWAIDHQMSTQQVKEVQHYMKRGGEGELGTCLVRHCDISQDRFNEVIGTKLIREGNYEEAMDYLAKVSEEYLRGIGITPYLLSRQNPAMPFRRMNYSDECQPVVGEVPNIKYRFCQQVIALKEQLARESGEKKAEVAYALAEMLYHASFAGDQWAMSEYSWSSGDYHYNELNEQSVHYLQLALDCTNDYNMKVQCHFGLAANPIPYAEPYVRVDNEKQRWCLYAPEGRQREAYKWLSYQIRRDDPLFETCDWLKLYVADTYE